MRDRVFGGVRIFAAGKADRASVWRLASVEHMNT